jgi:hypothetical protein
MPAPRTHGRALKTRSAVIRIGPTHRGSKWTNEMLRCLWHRFDARPKHVASRRITPAMLLQRGGRRNRLVEAQNALRPCGSEPRRQDRSDPSARTLASRPKLSARLRHRRNAPLDSRLASLQGHGLSLRANSLNRVFRPCPWPFGESGSGATGSQRRNLHLRSENLPPTSERGGSGAPLGERAGFIARRWKRLRGLAQL